MTSTTPKKNPQPAISRQRALAPSGTRTAHTRSTGNEVSCSPTMRAFVAHNSGDHRVIEVPRLNSRRAAEVNSDPRTFSDLTASANRSHQSVAAKGTATMPAIHANSVFHPPWRAAHNLLAAHHAA